MNGQHFLFLTFVLSTAGLFSACKTQGNKPGPYRSGAGYGQPQPARGEVTITPGSAAGFLATGYQPLETWMDERFRVRYENMPLNLVFEQKPISDIRYQLQNLPGNAPLFYLVSPSISRRELLREISRFYNLDMQVEMVNGQPGYVMVNGRGPVSGWVPEVSPPGSWAHRVPAALPVGPGSGQPPDLPVSRAKPVVEEGTAVPLSGAGALRVADRGEVTVEPATGRFGAGSAN